MPRWRSGVARGLRAVADRLDPGAGEAPARLLTRGRPLAEGLEVAAGLEAEGLEVIEGLDLGGAPEHWIARLHAAGVLAVRPRAGSTGSAGRAAPGAARTDARGRWPTAPPGSPIGPPRAGERPAAHREDARGVDDDGRPAGAPSRDEALPVSRAERLTADTDPSGEASSPRAGLPDRAIPDRTPAGRLRLPASPSPDTGRSPATPPAPHRAGAGGPRTVPRQPPEPRLRLRVPLAPPSGAGPVPAEERAPTGAAGRRRPPSSRPPAPSRQPEPVDADAAGSVRADPAAGTPVVPASFVAATGAEVTDRTARAPWWGARPASSSSPPPPAPSPPPPAPPPSAPAPSTPPRREAMGGRDAPVRRAPATTRPTTAAESRDPWPDLPPRPAAPAPPVPRIERALARAVRLADEQAAV